MKTKMTKRLGTLALASILSVTMLSSTAFAANCNTKVNLQSNSSTKVVQINYNKNMSLWMQKLLNNYKAKPVTQPAPAPEKPVTKPVPAPEKPVTQPAPAPEQPVTQPAPAPEKQAPIAGLTADEQKMLDFVNAERKANGLKPLQADMEIAKVARLKSKDMIAKNYFDHTSPTYGSPFDMMKQFGIQYNYAGENLAGNRSVEDAHKRLMESPGHRANILNPNFTHIGIGIVDGGPYGKMFTQMFIGR